MEHLATWHDMEEMQAAGLTKSIGVSNFTVEQLQHPMDEAKMFPAVNQVKLHPYLQQHEMVSFSAKNRI
jgi:diketogulonate reductase-like aldo/keto reductase